MIKETTQFMTVYTEQTRNPQDRRRWTKIVNLKYTTPEQIFNGKVAPYEVRYTDIYLFESPLRFNYGNSPVFKSGDMIGLIGGRWYKNGVKK